MITNQKPELKATTLSDHMSDEESAPAEAPQSDQTSTLLLEANAAMKEHPEGPAIDISNIAIEEVTHEESKKNVPLFGVSGIGVDML